MSVEECEIEDLLTKLEQSFICTVRIYAFLYVHMQCSQIRFVKLP